MKILLTGASGFLGKNLMKCFEESGNEVITLGRNSNLDIQVDIAKPFLLNNKYDLVVHAAGKAHIIPKTVQEEQDFFNTNQIGTHNLLSALETGLPKRFVLISTVAVYGVESGQNIAETHELLGTTPYAKSKIEAEKLVIDWGRANHVSTTILRLPLVSGKQPPGNLAAMERAIKKGYYFRIGDGVAKRSMVGAKDVADFILNQHKSEGIFNLTDDEHPSIKQTDAYIARAHKKKILVLPLWLTRVAASVGNIIPLFPVNTSRLKKLTSTLTFSNEKAKAAGWRPKPALDQLSF